MCLHPSGHCKAITLEVAHGLNSGVPMASFHATPKKLYNLMLTSRIQRPGDLTAKWLSPGGAIERGVFSLLLTDISSMSMLSQNKGVDSCREGDKTVYKRSRANSSR